MRRWISFALDIVSDQWFSQRYGVGRRCGVGRGLGVTLGVGVAVGVGVADGVTVGVGVGPDCAQYLPPVLVTAPNGSTPPPQTIISLSLQTAVCRNRAEGALMVLVAVQLSVLGLYLPPVFRGPLPKRAPPQTIISLPVQTAVCNSRPIGAFVVLVEVQLFVLGL